MPRKGMNGIRPLIHENSPDKTSSLQLTKILYFRGLFDYLRWQTVMHFQYCGFTDRNKQKSSTGFILIIVL